MKWIHQAHRLSSDLEAFLKAWLCNKGVLMPLHSVMHCILTRFIYITGAVKETWMTCSFSRWDFKKILERMCGIQMKSDYIRSCLKVQA